MDERLCPNPHQCEACHVTCALTPSWGKERPPDIPAIVHKGLSSKADEREGRLLLLGAGKGTHLMGVAQPLSHTRHLAIFCHLPNPEGLILKAEEVFCFVLNVRKGLKRSHWDPNRLWKKLLGNTETSLQCTLMSTAHTNTSVAFAREGGRSGKMSVVTVQRKKHNLYIFINH